MVLIVYPTTHRRSQGGAKGATASPKFLENMVILCFERRFAKQNGVIRLKSNIFAPLKFLGWLRHCNHPKPYFSSLMVTNCSGGRSFSRFKRIKNELKGRNVPGEVVHIKHSVH